MLCRKCLTRKNCLQLCDKQLREGQISMNWCSFKLSGYEHWCPGVGTKKQGKMKSLHCSAREQTCHPCAAGQWVKARQWFRFLPRPAVGVTQASCLNNCVACYCHKPLGRSPAGRRKTSTKHPINSSWSLYRELFSGIFIFLLEKLIKVLFFSRKIGWRKVFKVSLILSWFYENNNRFCIKAGGAASNSHRNWNCLYWETASNSLHNVPVMILWVPARTITKCAKYDVKVQGVQFRLNLS